MSFDGEGYELPAFGTLDELATRTSRSASHSLTLA
jgi:hypothetical protein